MKPLLPQPHRDLRDTALAVCCLSFPELNSQAQLCGSCPLWGIHLWSSASLSKPFFLPSSQIQSPLTLIPLSIYDLQPLIPYLCVTAASPSRALLTVPDNTVNASPPGSSAHCPLIHPGTQSKAWHAAVLPLMIQDKGENTKDDLPQSQPSFSSALYGTATVLPSATHACTWQTKREKRKEKERGGYLILQKGREVNSNTRSTTETTRKIQSPHRKFFTPSWFYKEK